MMMTMKNGLWREQKAPTQGVLKEDRRACFPTKLNNGDGDNVLVALYAPFNNSAARPAGYFYSLGLFGCSQVSLKQ